MRPSRSPLPSLSLPLLLSLPLVLLLLSLPLLPSSRAANTLSLTVPRVVAARLGAAVAKGDYSKAELVLRQGCRRPGSKEVSFSKADSPVALGAFEAEDKAFEVELPDCARDARVDSVEVQVRLTAKGDGGEVAEYSCGVDANVVSATASGCCGQRLSYRFASCLASDLPRLERSTYEFAFNASGSPFKAMCAKGEVRVRQFCAPAAAKDDESVGQWEALECDRGAYTLTAPPCVQPSETDGSAASTVTEYALEYRASNTSELKTCFGRSSDGLPDPASTVGAFAGNRRVYVTRLGLDTCPGETDTRLADTPEDVRKRQEAARNAELGGGQEGAGKPTNDSMNDGGSAGKALEAYQSCEALREKNPSAESGIYVLTDPDSGGNFRAYCLMGTAGGGWMLGLKQSRFGSGNALAVTAKARGDASLLTLDFEEKAALSLSLLQYGEPAEMLFVSGADTKNNWFTTAALPAYQNWTGDGTGQQFCAYRPEMLKQFKVSHSWDSGKTAVWSNTGVELSASADDKRRSAVTIGRYTRHESGKQCVAAHCASERHGRYDEREGGCAKGAAGEGDWLVFTRPKQRSDASLRYPLDPVLDRLAGRFISSVHWYSARGMFHGNWNFESALTWVGDVNGDDRDDYARLGATEIRFFISKGNGEWYEPIYRMPEGRNFGWNENVWTALKAIDVNGDGHADIVRASARGLYTYMSDRDFEDYETRCWYVAPNTVIPSGCMKEVHFEFRDNWSFSGQWTLNSPQVVVGDFNGDGLEDWVRLGSEYNHFFISKGDGTFYSPVYRYEAGTVYGFSESEWSTVDRPDVDGDGRTDLLRLGRRQSMTYFARGTNETCFRREGVMPYDCFEEVHSTYPHGWNFYGYWWGMNSRHRIAADFNGDGRTDFARVGGSYVHMFISRGDGYFDAPVYYYPHWWNFGHSNYWCQTLPAADYDGDGRADMAKSCGRTVYFFFSRGNTDDGRCWSGSHVRTKCFKPVVRHYPYAWGFYHGWNFDRRAVAYGDWNGDGKADWMQLMSNHYNHAFISMDREPKGLESPEVGQYNSRVSHHRWYMYHEFHHQQWRTVVADFNGDGRDDYVVLGRHSMRFFIAKKETLGGTSIFHMPEYRYPAGMDFTTSEYYWTTLRATDLDGNGRPDIVRTSHTYNHAFITLKGTAADDKRCFEHDGNMPDDCFRRTVFHYPDGWHFSGSAWHWNNWDTIQGDFDGDGLEDYARLGATYAHFFISKGDGSYWHPVLHYPSGWNFGWNSWGWQTLEPADYDGDGRTDFIRASYTYHHGFYPRGGKECWHHDGDVNREDCVKITNYRHPHGWHFSGAWHWYYGTTITGDFDGDGKMDFAKLGSPYIHFFISKGDGDFWTPVYHFPSYWGFGWWDWPWVTAGGRMSRQNPHELKDFDGDGRSDIIRTYYHYQHGFFPRGGKECWHRNDRPPSYRPMHCMQVTSYRYPFGWSFYGWWHHWGWYSTKTMDINGDGRTDLINLQHPQLSYAFLSREPNATNRDAEHPLLAKIDTPVGYYNHGWYFYWHWWMRSSRTLMGDFNGDGRDDYIRLGATYAHLFISKGDGTYYQPIYPYPRGANFGWSEWTWVPLDARDVTGDGRDDIIQLHQSHVYTFVPRGSNGDCWHRELWIPETCFEMWSQSTNHVFNGYWHWNKYNGWTQQGDFNGDGLQDFVHLGRHENRYFISKGNGLFHMPRYVEQGRDYGYDTNHERGLRPADADNDGRDDLLRVHRRGVRTLFHRGGDECWAHDGQMPDACVHYTHMTFPNGWDFYGYGSWSMNPWSTVQGDFDGDSRADFCRVGGTYMHCFVSKGDGNYWTPVIAWPSGYNFGHSEYWWTTAHDNGKSGNDWDGDGRADIVRVSGRTWYKFYSRGDPRQCWHLDAQHVSSEQCYHLVGAHYPHGWNFYHWWWTFHSDNLRVADFNGDGKLDWANMAHPRYIHQFLSKPEEAMQENRPAGEFNTPIVRYPKTQSFGGSWSFDSQSFVVGDFNGDGNDDYARLGDTKIFFFISKGNGTFYFPVYHHEHGTSFGWNENAWRSLAMDVNADRRADLVRVGVKYAVSFLTEGTNAECWHINGDIPRSCLKPVSTHYKGFTMDGSWHLNHRALVKGDWNGDGRKDFARLGATHIRFFVAMPDGSFRTPLYPFPSGWNFGWSEYYWATLPVGDHDGDGRDDIFRSYFTYNHGFLPRGTDEKCWHRDDLISTSCMRITGFGYGRHYQGWYHGWYMRRVHGGDFNNDGLADFSMVQGNYIHYFISKGDGSFYKPLFRFEHGWHFGWHEYYWSSLPAADYDGDGRNDRIMSYFSYQHGFFPRGSNERCWFHDDQYPNQRPFDCHQVTTFLYPNRWSFSGGWGWWRASVRALDLNGDGRSDFINAAGSTYAHLFIAEGDDED